jgi:hypothetical protein
MQTLKAYMGLNSRLADGARLFLSAEISHHAKSHGLPFVHSDTFAAIYSGASCKPAGFPIPRKPRRVSAMWMHPPWHLHANVDVNLWQLSIDVNHPIRATVLEFKLMVLT